MVSEDESTAAVEAGTTFWSEGGASGESSAAASLDRGESKTPSAELEAAVLQYKTMVAHVPGNAGLVLLGLLFLIGGPLLAVMSAWDALFNSGVGDDAAIAFTCFGGIGLGGLLIAVGTTGGKSHEKATNEAFQRMVSLSTTVKQEEPAPAKNRLLASVMGLVFLAVFFAMLDMVLLLVWVVPLVFAEYSYHSDKQKKRIAAEQAEMLVAIEQELNGK